MESISGSRSVIEEIKKQVRMFNLIVLITVYSLLLLAVKFLYDTLNYLPAHSFAAIIAMITILVAGGMYAVNKASKTATGRIEHYILRTGTLLSTTRSLRETVHTDILFDNILTSSMMLTGAQAGFIFLSEGDKLVFQSASGMESGKLKGLTVPCSGGIAGWALSTGSIARVDDVHTDKRFDSGVDLIIGQATQSLLCAPLTLDSKAVGILQLANSKEGHFSREDEDIISYFADQAAIAIRRAMFFEDQKNYDINVTDLLISAMDNLINVKSGHAKRVAKYSLLIAEGLKMEEEEKRHLYRACLLHDIGFLKIKPDTVASRDVFRLHPELGYEVLRQINFYADIAPSVLHHHERFDGKGYPAGLQGPNIPLESRIICIAEAFDAMVSGCSYKVHDNYPEAQLLPALRFSRAIRELNSNAGTQFDPELVKIFVAAIEEGQAED